MSFSLHLPVYNHIPLINQDVDNVGARAAGPLTHYNVKSAVFKAWGKKDKVAGCYRLMAIPSELLECR